MLLRWFWWPSALLDQMATEGSGFFIELPDQVVLKSPEVISRPLEHCLGGKKKKGGGETAF